MNDKQTETSQNQELASERFNLVAKATHDVIWDWDLVKSTVWWNEGMQLIFGYDQDELEPGPDSWYNRIHPEDQERILKHIHDVIDHGGANWSDYYRFRRADGSYSHVQDRGYTIHQDGRPVRMVGSMQDVTAQILSQKARQESEERLGFALKSAQLGTWNYNPASNLVEVDELSSHFFGYQGKLSVTYQESLQSVHPDDRKRIQTAILSAIENKNDGSYSAQFRAIHKHNSSVRWLQSKGQAYFHSNGDLYRFSGIVQDISDQVANQEKAYFADQQATMTIEGTGAGSFLLDISTDEIIYSPTMAKILTGESSLALSRDVFLRHLHPTDIDIRDSAYRHAAESGELNYEARFIWNDGSIHWVKVIGRYLFDKNGKGVSLSGILFEITDRVQAEQKLRSSEEHLRSLIEQAPVATALFVGKDMVIEIPNKPMIKIWGKGDSVKGKPLAQAVPELVGQPFLDILDQVYRTGETYHAVGQPAELNMDGTLKTYYFDFTYKPLLNKDGQVYAIMDMAVDVTSQVMSGKELKKSEERYRQLADELEVRVKQRTNELHVANQELVNSNNNLQQFAYAASHDMQEPLRKIQSFSSRLQANYTEKLDENGVFMLNRMQDAARRMSEMIDDLLAYSRLTTTKGELTPVDLNLIVAEVISDLEIVIQEQNAQIEVGNLSEILGSSRQLIQLIQNLVSNALKYRKPDQSPFIKITSRKVEYEEVTSFSNVLKDNHYICLEIQDNGIGFDEKYLDRIFQMFQRLHGKGEFNGSGIGLALCKKVVQNHHGYITARSKPGTGSTFMVYLPQPA
ncbi:PAS domain-containing sensor histidine kinase [Dyadobacter psychrotolerans]|uniref:histidine kinase n=1 Tax=Dyadobacter psychrotolerans TaxID=2541721 RepID=A0A4R5DW02_9BACT|nr:PAS domain-containing protein [Dyadobacter psychrotolerans]TDE15425.1 PAS domain S-box protein [Dyadobacter psychrotolerans]